MTNPCNCATCQWYDGVEALYKTICALPGIKNNIFMETALRDAYEEVLRQNPNVS